MPPIPHLQLFLENALVGFVCECMEFACGITLILAKAYLEHFYHPRKRREAERRALGDIEAANGIPHTE